MRLILVIVIIMIYISWCIVLWGMWVCSVHQNLRDWLRRRRPWRDTPAERETLALRLGVLLAIPLLDGPAEHRRDEGELADELGVPRTPVCDMIELFREHGLAVQAADENTWMLARAPEKVTALDVLRLVRQGSLAPQTKEQGILLNGSESHVREPLARWTLAALAKISLDEIETLKL